MQLKFAHKIIVVSAVLLILALTVTTTINYISLKNDTQENLNRAIDEIGHSVASNIANWLSGRLQIISAIAENTQPNDSPEAMMVAVRQAVKAGKLKNTYIGVEATVNLFLMMRPFSYLKALMLVSGLGICWQNLKTNRHLLKLI